MEVQSEDYRGYTISVVPMKDHDDLWDFEYHLVRDGQNVAPAEANGITRMQTLGGYASAEVAAMAGIQVAKTEIDNLLALERK